jgi:putative peptidoglycan lipid II flippase
MQNTFTPFWINAIENGANIVLAVALFSSLGVQGLGLAWSGAYILAAVLAIVVLGRHVAHRVVDRQVLLSALRAGLGTVALAIVAAALAGAIGHATSIRAFEATAVAGIGGIAAYLLVLVLLRTPELGQLIGVLRRRAVAADT